MGNELVVTCEHFFRNTWFIPREISKLSLEIAWKMEKNMYNTCIMLIYVVIIVIMAPEEEFRVRMG